MTPREAARRLGVSYPTVKQWIYKGVVRTAPTAGGHHRIPDIRSRAPAGVERAAHAAPTRPHTGAIVALSGRNQLRGIVEEVRVDGLLAQVRLRIGDQSLTAVITRDAVDELKLRRGDEALAVIKSTEVMIGRAGGSNPPQQHERPGLHLRRRPPALSWSPEPLVSASRPRSRCVSSTIVHRSPHFASRQDGTRAPRGAR